MARADETPGKAQTELLTQLERSLRRLGRVAVAFSGGVDSSVVLAASIRSLGSDNVLAVTADSESYPASELQQATELADALGVRHQVIATRELDDERFSDNPPDRCFYCKTELWRQLGAAAGEQGIEQLADGANADDAGDHRPGIQAGDQAGVHHPLMEIGAGKQDVRALARELGLPNWDKPAQACLSSRFPYGSRLTASGLERVETAERFLADLDLGQLRVRDHGEIARIEVDLDSLGAISVNGLRERIVERFKELGYTYVTLDLEGFRSGSMNETL